MNHAGEVYPIGFPVETLTGISYGGVATPLRKLAIVGSHPATRELAPYEDPEFEIWLFNEAAMKPEIYRRWDALLQIHKPEVYASEANWVNPEHWKWLQMDHGDKRIFMQEHDERVPNSVRYPIEQVRALIPYPYIRSSPALALALGIVLGYQHIALYGSELTSNTEYRYQSVNLGFWIGFAVGYGVDLDLQCWHSEFYEQPIYGYEGEPQINRKYFEDRYQDLHTIWRGKDKSFLKVKDRFEDAVMNNKFQLAGELSLNLEQIAVDAGEAYGAMTEAERYAARDNEISRQEFERVTAQSFMDGEKAQKNMNHSAGKCEYVWNAWMHTGNLEARKQFRAFVKEKTEYAFECGKLLGIHKENGHYLGEYDKLVTALGGSRAVYQIGGGNGKG